MHLGCLDHVLQAGFKLLAECVDGMAGTGFGPKQFQKLFFFVVAVFGAFCLRTAVVRAQIETQIQIERIVTRRSGGATTIRKQRAKVRHRDLGGRTGSNDRTQNGIKFFDEFRALRAQCA